MTQLADNDGLSPATAWRSAGIAAALLAAAVLAIHAGTAIAAVKLWGASATHAFSYLIVPIAGYFVWLRRDALAAIAPRPSPAAALLALPAAAVWFAGELAQAAVVAQFALVALLQAGLLALIGWPAYRALLFPLQLLWLLVPFGEALLPAMIDLTVLLTMAGLQLLGMAVEADGNILVTEIGRYAIVEACSALDFLIGNAVITLVYANLMFSGWRKRLAYVLAGLPVAILANGLRTTSVIYLTYASGGELNLIAEHETYGWLLFCAAVTAQMAVGWRLRDPAPAALPARPAAPVRPATGRLVLAMTVVLAAAAAAPALERLALARHGPPGTVALCAPPSLGPATAPDGWRPALNGADAELAARYSVDGRAVDLYAGYWARPAAEMVSWRNRPESSRGWAVLDRDAAVARIDGADQAVASLRLRGPDRARRLAWRVYWVDGRLVTADWSAKLLRARSTLFGGGEAATLVLATDGNDPAAAAVAIQGLLDRAGFVGPMLQAARSGAGC